MMIRTVQHDNAITPSDTGQSPAWWGMMLMILTEAALFASLLLAYFYERSNSPAWPPAGIKEPELLLPIIMTALLLGSSATMVMAELGIKQGRDVLLRLGLVLSIVLAVAFLSVQVYEYQHKTFSIGDNVYSSAFYTITGIHGLHVAIAVIMGLFITARAFLGHFRSYRHVAVSVVALYWHFVDVVWLFIFASLYLSPHVL